MIRASLGVSHPGGELAVQGHRVSDTLFTLAGVGVGAVGSAWVNGRFPSKGQDHLVFRAWGKEAPADLTVAGLLIGGVILGIIPDGYSTFAIDIAFGIGAQYLTRAGTGAGNKARLNAAVDGASKPADQQMAAGASVHHIGVGKYKMTG